ncbi:MAG TPA: hypothetical protein VHW02_04845 [Rhizomicrobium sp.]|jgi:hypothetical protein|nr:hypothetical protein [Rhizomicrobium sp.]
MRHLLIFSITLQIILITRAGASPTIELMMGQCHKLVAASHDLGGCDGKLANVNLDDGSTTFSYSKTDGTALTFVGRGDDQVKVNADEVMQPIQKVIFHLKTAAPVTTAAAGTCHYTNPFKGKAIVNCTATASTGQFEGSFTTDGKPPSEGP